MIQTRPSRSAAIIQQIPWIAPLLHKLPFVSKNLRRLRQFGVERVKARKANGSLTKDLFYHLVRAPLSRYLGPF